MVMPGFKVQGAGGSKDWDGFEKGKSGRIWEIRKVSVVTLRKSQNAK